MDARNGRYAPSPSGDLHVGNLRTALIAWALARQDGLGFVIRVEDLDERSRPRFVLSQLDDLARIGVTWDGEPLLQTERINAYDTVLQDLLSRDLLYECYCTRADIRQAPSAPHAPPGSYLGTCRDLTDKEREAGRLKLEDMTRGPALRLRTGRETLTITDRLCGDFTGHIDDFVIQRGDGVYAYNFVAVVDDAYQSVGQVVRADDLLESTPRQVYLQRLLGYDTPEYVHVPLVTNSEGKRLAKRDGAVTLDDLNQRGVSDGEIFRVLTGSLGAESNTVEEFLERFDPSVMSKASWIFDPEILT